MSGLSAMERSKLVLDSYKFDSREDPLIRRTMPTRQGPAFNEAIYRMNACNMHIAGMINGLEADLQFFSSQWLLMYSLAEWSFNLQEIEDAIGNAPRGPRGGRRAAQTAIGVSLTGLRPLLELTPAQRGLGVDQGSLEQQHNAIGARLVKAFGNMWQSMRAVEIVLDEMTAYFEGIDPLKPVHRKRLVEVRQGLEELAESLALYDFEVEWREPDVEMLALVRGTVSAMRNLMG